jgi:hypothetical protein
LFVALFHIFLSKHDDDDVKEGIFVSRLCGRAWTQQKMWSNFAPSPSIHYYVAEDNSFIISKEEEERVFCVLLLFFVRTLMISEEIDAESAGRESLTAAGGRRRRRFLRGEGDFVRALCTAPARHQAANRKQGRLQQNPIV